MVTTSSNSDRRRRVDDSDLVITVSECTKPSAAALGTATASKHLQVLERAGLVRRIFDDDSADDDTKGDR